MSKNNSKIAVKLENQTFNSLSEACRYLQLKHAAGLSYAVKHGKDTFNGLKLEVLSRATPKKVTKGKKRNCPVICETTGKRYKTIRQAARAIGVNDWTMSKKMETAGQFKDKLGNIYKRVRPMNTKNIYENTGDMLLKPHTRRKQVDERQVVMEMPAQRTIDRNKIARDALKEKAAQLILNDNFTDAKSLLEVIDILK